MSEHLHTNALAQETSPYLLQHAHNPVQWYPWCAEALNRAANEDKPILLSIGYSACHWCHVMERESFENEDIASLMNRYFINIKVDREERPDLDAIYMNSVQLMTGSGGWPLTVFLTPDLVPFYGGTYFPPADRYGMPGFPQVLQSVARAYRDNRAAVQANAAEISANLQRTIGAAGTISELTAGTLDGAIRNLVSNYDSENGGFGSAPKFPPSMALSFLLRSSKRKNDGRLLEIVEQTLNKMAHGGIYDQLGGGFHRYSVDPHWLVPHFEKMLYDNALLSRIYLDAYLATKNQLYRRIAEETLDYVLREMTSPEGGFYSTQDADSEGHEGKFFVWTPGEVETVLGEQDADLFNRYYDVTPEGNFEQKNILHVPRDAGTVAKICGVSEQRLGEAVSRGRRLLHAERNKRIKPGRDEKILTAWNGLMLRSLAEAANALDRDDYRDTAVRNAEFMLSKLQSEGMLLRSFKDGKARFNAYLEDYAFLADGLLALYEATFDIRWMREAMRLGSTIIEQFKDPESYGFYFTSSNHEHLIQRPKEFFDNAVPSGNSVAAFCLLRLWKFTSEAKWLDHARPLLEGMAAVMERYPSGFGNFLCAADFCLSNQMEIAVVGDPLRTETQELLRVILNRYLPNKVVSCGTGDEPFLLGGRRQINHQPTVYVCSNYACRTPVTTQDALDEQLSKY